MQHGEVSGKTYLVTGSTDGIGRHTASKLVAAGANVLLHGRTQEKVTATKRDLDSIAKGNKISSYTYNLASLSQIRKFAEAIRADHNNIDVLINNAGSSIDFDNLQQEKGFSSHNSYSLSKLASMMFTCDLAEHMKPKGVTVNCLDPGTVNTKMLIAGWGACGIDVKDANYEYKLATDPSLAKETGKYYVNARDEIPALVRLSTQLYRLCKNVSHVWQTTCIPMEPNEVALLMSRVHSQLLFADAPGSAVVLCWQQ
ncbi:hypothetical protein WJX79_007944 [Trebouxia sp. C0005]